MSDVTRALRAQTGPNIDALAFTVRRFCPGRTTVRAYRLLPFPAGATAVHAKPALAAAQRTRRRYGRGCAIWMPVSYSMGGGLGCSDGDSKGWRGHNRR